MRKETNAHGFYIAQVSDIPEDVDYLEISDDEFIEFANEFMTVGFFQISFNECLISTETQVIRYV